VKKINVAVLALAMAGAGLGAHASGLGWAFVTDTALIERSANLPVYADAPSEALPKAVKDLGYVSAAVCTFQDDSSISRSATLSQLRARAALKGADAIVNMRLVINSNARSSCWHRGYIASGEAVAFR
jgi:uncharacterized protein YbjQ (UPF0145 family)